MTRQAKHNQAFRRPVPRPGGPIIFPGIQKAHAENGLPIWLVERHDLPLVTIHFVFHAGADRDRPGMLGLATMTVESLDAGTETMTTQKVAERMDAIGARLRQHATVDGASVSLTVLSSHLDEAASVMAEVIARPTFPAEEFDRRIRQRRSALLQELDKPASVAWRALNRILYGPDHPYGNDPDGYDESLAAMSRDDAVRFWSDSYRPNNGTLIAVGDTTLDRLREVLNRELGTWRGSGLGAGDAPVSPPLGARRVFLINMPHAPQSEIRIGRPAISRASPDVYAVSLMNRILGGQFSSRLNANLREKRGLTYGVHTAFFLNKGNGPFVASTGVVQARTDEAVREMVFEIERMHTEGLSEEELRFSQTGQIGSFALSLETPAQIAGAMHLIALYGLPDDYLEHYTRRLEEITPDDIRRVSLRYLNTGEMAVLVVGDLTEIRKGVEELRLGEIVVCDPQGNPLHP